MNKLIELISKKAAGINDDTQLLDILTKEIKFDTINLHKYINCGAYPTDTVRHLIYKTLINI